MKNSFRIGLSLALTMGVQNLASSATVMNLDSSDTVADWYFNAGLSSYPNDAVSWYSHVTFIHQNDLECNGWLFNDFNYYNGHVYGCGQSFADAQAQAVSQMSVVLDQMAATFGPAQSIVGVFQGQVYGQIRYNRSFPAPKNIPNKCDAVEPSPPTAGNPIVLAGGAKFQAETDYSQPDHSLRISRYYSSQGESSGDMGGGWAHDYSAHLRGNTTLSDGAIANGRISKISAIRDDGGARLFDFTSSGIVAEDGAHSKLSYANGQFMLFDYDDKVVEVYDATGALLHRTAVDGKYITVTRSNQAVAVADNFGRVLTFSLDPSGTVSSVVLPDGNTIRYGYGLSAISGQNLASVTLADGFGKGYFYSNPVFTNALTEIQDESGVSFARWAYDISGMATMSEHAGGVDHYEVFNAGGTNPSVLMPNMQTIAYSLTSYLGQARLVSKSAPAGSGCGATTLLQTVDATGNITSADDVNGNRACYAYDATRKLRTIVVEGLQGGQSGKSCAASLSDYVPAKGDGAHPERKITTSWHPDWPLKVREAAPKRITTWVYSGQPDPVVGGAASCAPANAVLPDGSPIAVLCSRYEQATTDDTGAFGLSAATSGVARVWSYTYNESGQMLTETLPQQYPGDTQSHTTTYTYYADTSLSANTGHTLGDVHTVANPLGQITTYSSYDGAGRLLSSTDVNGVTTSQTYFPRGWIKSQTRTAATGDSVTTTYDYWPTGLLKSVTMPDQTAISYTYDGAHRLADITDAAGNRIHYVLDNAGNRIADEISDSSGQLASVVSRVFDALNRVQSTTGVARY